ncbi:hypothetical protein NQ315_008740 [Exocentrus adspersus]|uniref:Myb/SANT-like domain-containing protein n=1 Tax=Exocentrus adspersus TaxID=1586481 RepID=A0AAV8VGU6_9CUCU|nr:hypothetical protein NQ315_008740 [Exocentrus adspersus]
MSFKVREAHWQVLHEEMDKNAVLATGKFVGPKGRENYKKLWDEAAKKLNSLGYGLKSTDKWQKGFVNLNVVYLLKMRNLSQAQVACKGHQ